MEVLDKKYKIEDLKIGMIVKRSQLSNIYDTRIILLDTKLLPDNDVEGKLAYYGESNTPEYNKFFVNNFNVTPIYNNSSELMEGVVFDG